jgi:hypothetical protein
MQTLMQEQLNKANNPSAISRNPAHAFKAPSGVGVNNPSNPHKRPAIHYNYVDPLLP